MNWLDFVLLAILVVGAFMGMRMGIIGAAFIAIGAFVGWLLGGQFSDDIGGLFDSSLSNDTLVTVVSYAIIIVASVAVANFVVKFVRPLLTIFTLGMSSMVDKMGSLALGLLVGIAISSVLIIVLARLTYDFDTTSITGAVTGAVPSQVAEQVTVLDDQIARIEDAKEQLETSLTDSALVSLFIDVTDAIPASTLGFVPSDFKAALDILESKIDS